MTSPTTDDFFGFSHRPFRATPDPQDYVSIESIEQEIARLVTAVEQGDGVSVITASPGAGKTVLCERLRVELSAEFQAAVLSSSGFATRRSLLQAILFALGQPYESFSEQELRLSVLNFARSVGTTKEGIALIVDEAHLLNPRLLEELRCLTNHSEGGRPLIRVVLCGQLPLEDVLVRPELQSLNYRITCHATLEPLSVQESAQLIAGRLLHAGRTINAIFAPAALETICRVSDGNPRCLIQLCDQSLTNSAQRGEAPVTVESVRLALRELKQLPLQWNESAIDQVLSGNEPADHTEADHTDADHADDDLVDEPHAEVPADHLRREQEDASTPFSTEWSSPVVAVEVGSEEDIARDDIASDEVAIDDVASDDIASEDATLSDEEFPASEAEPAEQPTAGWTSYETSDAPAPASADADEIEATSTKVMQEEPQVQTCTREDVRTATIPGKTTIPGETTADFVELPVEDSYAFLDHATFGGGTLRKAADLAAELSSTVAIGSSPAVKTAPPTAAPHEVEQPDVSANRQTTRQTTRQPLRDPVEQIDEVMSALSALTGESDERRMWSTADEWRMGGDSRDYDRVEPSDEAPQWESPARESFSEPDAAADRDTGLREDAPAAGPRPYARLFSRLRRQRA